MHRQIRQSDRGWIIIKGEVEFYFEERSSPSLITKVKYVVVVAFPPKDTWRWSGLLSILAMMKMAINTSYILHKY